jgi:capsule polysaccharide export protein KpsE/RkpR
MEMPIGVDSLTPKSRTDSSMKQSSPNTELEALYHPHPTEEEVSREVPGAQVVDRLRLLWDHRRFLFRMAAWGLATATVIAFLIPARYESTTRLMPPDDNKAGSAFAMMAALGGNLPGGLQEIAGDVLGTKSTGALFTGILVSRTVQDSLVTKFDLKKVYGTKLWYKARRRLLENTAISEDRKNGIITVTVTDHDPRRAAAMAAEYVSQLNVVVNQLSTSSAHRERVFLEERLKQVKQDLEAAERDFGDFASKNTAVDIKEQAKAMVTAAATLQGEIIAAQSQLEGLRQVYAENAIRVRSLRARITELQVELKKLGGKYEAPGATDDAKDDSLYPSIRKLPVLGEAYADLYRRTRVQEAVFEILTRQYELAKVAEAKEIPSVKVLDSPDIAERRSFPPRLLIMFLGLFLAFAGGVTWRLGRSAWERVPEQMPGKQLAQDVFHTIRATIAGAASNGSGEHLTHRLWRKKGADSSGR